MDELRDLVPRRDPKGGSPRSPTGGVPLRAYQQYSNGNGNATVWKVLFSIVTGLLISMTIAYFTALRGQGVSKDTLDTSISSVRKEMQEYIERNSPYARDKELISRDNSNQDRAIGELIGKQDRIFERLKTIEEKHIGYDRDLLDHEHKLKLLTDYVFPEKTPKR